MITDEELKIYSSLSGREQLDEFNRLMKKDKGKSIKDILEKYEEIWKNTKSENLDVVREYLISTIKFFFKTVCVNKINIAIEYDHYLGNLEIENDLDNMLEQLYKQKSLDSVYKYISQLKESKSYFELVKTYKFLKEKNLEDFEKLYNLFSNEEEMEKYFENIEEIKEWKKQDVKEYSIEILINNLIESTPIEILEKDPKLFKRIIEDDRIDFIILGSKLSEQQNISESIKKQILPILREKLNSTQLGIFEKKEILNSIGTNLQLELKDDLVEFLINVKSWLSLEDIWSCLTKETQNAVIDEVLAELEEKYKDSLQKDEYRYMNSILSIWGEASKEVQEQNEKIFWQILQKVNKYHVKYVWEKTKIQEELFEKVYQNIINPTDNNFEFNLSDFWKGTSEELQKNNLSRIIEENPEKQNIIFANTKENIQREYFSQKEVETRKYGNIKELAELYCGLNDDIKKERPELFWEFYEKYSKEDPDIAIKIWSSMSVEFQTENFDRAFELIENDTETLKSFWLKTKTVANEELAKQFVTKIKGNKELVLFIANFGNTKIIPEIMETQNDINTQILIWDRIGEYNQEKNIEWFNRILEEHKDESETILNLWNSSKKSIQEKHTEVIYRLIKENKLTKEGYSNLLNCTSEKLLTDDVLQKIFENIDKENATQLIEKYKQLKSMNPTINSTLNIGMLNKRFEKYFHDDDLVKLTTDKPLQKIIQDNISNPNFEKVIELVMNKSQNWILEINTICNNISSYTELINNIKDKQLTNKQVQQFYFCLLENKNWFNVQTSEDLDNYSENIRQISREILEGKNVQGRISKEFENLSDNEKNIFAILQLSYGMDISTAKNLVYKYGTDIQEISKGTHGKDEAVIEIQHLKTLLQLTVEEAKQLYEKNKEKILNWNEIQYSVGAHIEEKALKLYEQLYREELRTEEIPLENSMYKGKEVPTSEIIGDFKTFIRVEGAYSKWEEPEDFSTYFNEVDPKVNGNCKSFIANNLFARARPKGPTFGYNQCKNQSLLIMAPWDIVSNDANHSFSPSSANWNYMKGISFRTPNGLIDSTRDNHNEVVTQKWTWDEISKSIERDLPDFVLYVKPKTEFDVHQDPAYEMSLKAAAQLGLPLKIIDTEKNMAREQEKINTYIRVFNGEIPNNTKMSNKQLIKRIIVELENNRVAMRFVDEELKSKYFTSQMRQETYDKLQEEISKYKDIDRETYQEFQKVYNQALEDELGKAYTSRGIETASAKEKNFFMMQKAKNLNTQKIRDFGINEKSMQMMQDTIKNVSKLKYYDENKAHSIEHIEKVTLFAGILSELEGLSEEDKKILLAASAFHDSGRSGKDGNTEHAEASAMQVKEYFLKNPNNPFGITKANIGIIQTAIHYHEHKEKYMGQIDNKEIERLSKIYKVNPIKLELTKKICELLKDADALDRYRFANRATLNPAFLRSQSSKTFGMINFARNVNREMAKKILEQIYGKPESEIIQNLEVKQLREERIKNTTKKGDSFTEKHLPLNALFEIIGLEQSQEKSETKNNKLLNLYKTYGITPEDIASIEHTFSERAIQSNERGADR